MQKKLTLFLVLMFAFFGLTLVLFKGYAKLEHHTFDDSYTFFSYNVTKIENLATFSSPSIITEEHLQEEDKFVAHFLAQRKTPFLDRLRIYTYLYAAQREFAFLSHSAKHHFEGNLHFLTVKILNLFYPDYSPIINIKDAYSEKLTNIIFAPFFKRFEEEKTLKNSYSTDQWIPWMAKPSSHFFPPAYHRNQLSAQIKEVMNIQNNASAQEKKNALYWEGGLASESGDWIAIGNHHIFNANHNLSLGKIILIRNLLSITLFDAEIIAYDAKYHFGAKRPFEINNAIIPLGSRPSSPSYPSSHATLASGATVLLTFFLPDEKATFIKIRDEACYSRLVSGAHIMLDVTEGKKMGEKIAHEVLIKQWNAKEKMIEDKHVKIKGQSVRLAQGKYSSRPKCCSRKALWQRLP